MSVFKRAEKQQLKLKIAITGPSGSGKTRGALALAQSLVPGGRIAVADTENRSASLYAHHAVFDTVSIGPPFLSEKYESVIEAAATDGYDVLVIDSVSHQWDGEGGILQRKEQVDARGGNSFTNWSKFTPEHTRFMAKILHSPIHIIATMRSKQEFILEDNGRGKQMPKKVGLAPIQRQGSEYDYSIVFDLQMDHNAIASKDRTELFPSSRMLNLLDPKVGAEIAAWLSSAKPEAKATPEQIETMLDLAAKISEKASEEVQKRIKAGMTEDAATQFIQKLEARIAQGAA